RAPGTSVERLGDAVRASVIETGLGEGVELSHSVHGAQRQLPPTVVSTCYRIAKEAAINAVKHGEASSIVVRLTYAADRVLLDIADDGCGWNTETFEEAAGRGHWGIAGMYERARAAGGTLSLSSTAKMGTRVSVSLPAGPIT